MAILFAALPFDERRLRQLGNGDANAPDKSGAISRGEGERDGDAGKPKRVTLKLSTSRVSLSILSALRVARHVSLLVRSERREEKKNENELKS